MVSDGDFYGANLVESPSIREWMRAWWTDGDKFDIIEIKHSKADKWKDTPSVTDSIELRGKSQTNLHNFIFFLEDTINPCFTTIQGGGSPQRTSD